MGGYSKRGALWPPPPLFFVLLSFRDDRSFNMAIKQQRSYLCHQTRAHVYGAVAKDTYMASKCRAGFAWQLLVLRIFFFGLSTTMEERVAQAVRCMGEDDFDLFGPSDRAALTELVTDRDSFRRDEQDSNRYARAYTPPQPQLMFIHKLRHRRSPKVCSNPRRARRGGDRYQQKKQTLKHP